MWLIAYTVLSMTTADLDEKVRELFTFAPVPGKPNVLILTANAEDTPEPDGEPMTEADWDKFEADIKASKLV
jgi:hypothetical protein